MAGIHPLLVSLVDDAGLFPPERLPMGRAVARHRSDVASGHPVLTQRFLCPASSLDALRDELGPDEQIRLGLIVDTGPSGIDRAVAAAAGDARLRVETVEVALPAAATVAAARAHADQLAAVSAPVFVEVPRTADWRAVLEVLAAVGLGAKIRCGGIDATLFPTRDELAALIAGLTAHGIAFKATAGLHRALRYRDPSTGFDHHGFGNLLLAVVAAVEDGPLDDVAAALAVDDGPTLSAALRAVDHATARRARRSLVAYGSCSTAEPVADLRALGLLDDGNQR